MNKDWTDPQIVATIIVAVIGTIGVIVAALIALRRRETTISIGPQKEDLAEIKEKMGEMELALAEIVKRLPPAAPDASVDEKRSVELFNEGVDQYQTGRYDEAIISWRAALKLNSTLAQAHHNLDVVLRERVLDEALDKMRVDISFESTPIQDVVNFLRTLVDLNIALDSLVPEDTTITLELRDVSLRAALNNICMLGENLSYTIRNEALWITTKERS